MITALLLSTLVSAQPGVKDIDLPPIERFTTKEGLNVVAVKRGQLPLVAVHLSVKAGSAMDPAGKLGLADFTARLLRRGTKKLSAEQIDEAVEFVGATLSVGASEDFLSCSATTPAEHLDRILDVLAQLVREPSFPERELEMARSRLMAQIPISLDDPSQAADLAFVRAVWGEGHPYAHPPHGRKKDLAGLKREDVVRFHQQRIVPGAATLYVVGTIDVEQLKASVERAFAGWKGAMAEAPLVLERTRSPNDGRIIVVDKPEQTQAQLRIAGPGFRRASPDTFAASVLNAALGGGFTSRLVNEARVNRGLTYSVGSHFIGLKAGGYFEVATFTKTETTRELIDLILAELRKARTAGLTANELSTSKRYLAGLYPLRFETNEAVAAALADVDFYGVGVEWIEKYRSKISDVTPAAATEAATRYLPNETPLIVIAGRAADIVPQLKGLGDVRVIRPSELE